MAWGGESEKQGMIWGIARHVSSLVWVLALACLVLSNLTLLGLLWSGTGAFAAGAFAAEGEDVAATDEQAFVADDLCRDCHQPEHDDWLASHHKHAMAPATADTVLGKFDGTHFTYGGVTTLFLHEGDRYYLQTRGPDGLDSDFDVLFTFGYYPLQQYLVALPGGRLQAYDVAWDVTEERWFKLHPEQKARPGAAAHWSGADHLWNTACADCHTTNFQKNFDPDTGSFASKWSGISVGCQACHGPGAAHVAWAGGLNETVVQGDAIKGLPFRSGGEEAQDELVVCVPCHSRRRRISQDQGVSRELLDEILPMLLDEKFYRADGQMRGEDRGTEDTQAYVYGSFLQSREYQAGVSCSDCHLPHSGGLRAEGNAVCVACHQEAPPGRFETLAAGLYDSPEHHKHPQDSEGARCVNCHMPEVTFRQVDGRRDHSLRTPRPDLSSRLGVPNACTQCHQDQTDRWAAVHLDEWFGTDWRRPHFGEVLHAGRRALPGAMEQLTALIADASQPSIVRATALSLLPRNAEPQSSSETPPSAALVNALGDEDPLVREAALQALRPFTPQQRWDVASALLRDPVRAVRIAAGRALAAVSRKDLSLEERMALTEAIAAYVALQKLSLETLEANLNLAGLYVELGQLAAAEAAFVRAMKADPDALAAILPFAALYDDSGRFLEAAALLETAIDRQPENAALHHALGLLLSGQNDSQAATAELRKAAELDPRNPQYKYVLAGALARDGETAAALEQLQDAHFFAPNDRKILVALAVVSKDRGEIPEAIAYAEQLLDLDPSDQQARQLLEQIEKGG